ncbi:MAG: hypothetical protein LAO51_11720 [Acidobacteriia bacterium]|nr:hypothetical protein [Terriglobia bacterium]
MTTTRETRRPGPDPKPHEERRSILVGVKVSPRELTRFRSAARSLPVATWMRSRALEALEIGGAEERADAFLTQAKAFRDRADEALREMDREFDERIAAVDRLLERAERAAQASPRGKGRGSTRRKRGGTVPRKK